MVNFIIYEDNQKFRELYISVILKIIGKTNLAYEITEIDKYDKNTLSKINSITGKKIIILDIEVPGKSGLDLAREIRNDGDWTSPMIMISSHEHLKDRALTARMLMLDFISKYFDVENNLKENIKIALDILSNHDSMNFQYNGELFQIPYEDILYIEKNVDDPFSTIVSKTSTAQIKKSISSIEKDLKGRTNFFRCHRSCIVNLNNITSVDLRKSVIRFGIQSTNLLSRDKKLLLKDLLTGKGLLDDEVRKDD